MMFGLTLETLKAYLGYDVVDSSRDVQLTQLLNAAIAAVQSLLGRSLVYGNYRDTMQYMDQRVHLREWPVASITSVKLNGTDIPNTEYLTFLKSGYLHFRNWRFRSTLCDGEYLIVEYVGGYQTLPADMLQAIYQAIQVANSVQQQYATVGGVIKRLSVYDVGVTDLAVPRDGSSGSIRDMLESSLGQYINAAGNLGGWVLHESELVSEIEVTP